MVALAQQFGSASAIPSGPVESDGRRVASTSEAAHDAQLVRRFKTGDEEAFVEIVERYHKKMFTVALRHLRNRADADEIAQDTLIRAHRALAGFRGESSLSTWLHRIAFNLARNRHKHNFSRRRHVTYSLDYAISDDGRGTFADLVACDVPDPARVATSRDFSALVVVCMEKLSDRQREILVMRNGLSDSYGAIARKLGISIGTVKSRIGRARESLRALLGEYYPELRKDTSIFEWFEPMRPSGSVAIASA
jgi:RNA polymerase sigma-70 factor (ECF subfamily)